MKKAFIKAVSYYLPENILTNEDIAAEFPEWTAEKVGSKIGIHSRRVASEQETAADMAQKAAEKLFAEHGIDRQKIDFILLCTQSPDYFLPTSACILQDRLGISNQCGALDFNLGCSGYVYGLALAKGLVMAGIGKNILLLTAETYSKYLHPKDKGNRTIFGDAASATLISDHGPGEILGFSLGTDGSGAENLIVKTGAHRNPNKTSVVEWDEYGNPISSDFLYMSGTEIFNLMLGSVPKLVQNTLMENSLKIDDISLFVFHQANKYVLEFLRKKIRIPQEKFFIFMEQVGNTVSSTIPIALEEARKMSLLSGKILLSGFGVGYSWGGAVIDYGDPEKN